MRKVGWQRRPLVTAGVLYPSREWGPQLFAIAGCPPAVSGPWGAGRSGSGNLPGLLFWGVLWCPVCCSGSERSGFAALRSREVRQRKPARFAALRSPPATPGRRLGNMAGVVGPTEVTAGIRGIRGRPHGAMPLGRSGQVWSEVWSDSRLRRRGKPGVGSVGSGAHKPAYPLVREPLPSGSLVYYIKKVVD